MSAKATIKECKALSGGTDKALRVKLGPSAGGRTVWVPKSAVHDDSEVYEEDHFGKLVVKPWFANQIGVELD